MASALRGRLLVRKGRVWTALRTGTDKDLFTVWTNGDEVFAAGDEGKMVRCAHGLCSSVKTGIEEPIYQIDGASPQDLTFATSGSLFHFDGVHSRRIPGPGEPGVEVIEAQKSAAARRPDGVLYVSAIAPDPRGGLIVERTDGSFRLAGGVWTRMGEGGGVGLAVGDPKTGEMLAVYGGCAAGKPSRVRRFDGAAWHDEALPLAEFDTSCLRLSAIWNAGAEVFIVGDAGVILHKKP